MNRYEPMIIVPGDLRNEHWPKSGQGLSGILPGAVGQQRGPNILVDGDCEAADASAWTAFRSATLSKQTTAPFEGARVLRVAHGGLTNPSANQTVMTAGVTCRITGVARSDGTGTPTIYDGVGVVVWTGTNATSWQAFDVTFVPTDTVIRFRASGVGAGDYVEWDDLYLSST